MDTLSAFLSFVDRINDAYVAGLTIHDLITDNDYQRLTVKHGKAVGTPLGNRHMLPGYWFTVFVAPFESLQRLMECVRIEKEQNDKHKTMALWESAERLRDDIDILLASIDPEGAVEVDTFPNKKPLLHVKNAIGHGSYDFGEIDGDVTVTFHDYDQLCGYQFVGKVTVSKFNRFASDFLNRVSELLYPLIERHREIAAGVEKMQFAEITR